MTLTKALFAERVAQERLITGQFACDIQAVRGQLDTLPRDRTLAVDVAFRDAKDQRLPPHLHAYGRVDREGTVVTATFALQPADGRRRWPEDFVPDTAVRAALGLRFQDGRHFRDGTHSAEVTFAGTVAKAAVVQEVPRAAIPRELVPFAMAGGLPPGLAPVLRAARRHPFGRMAGLTAEAEFVRCDPVAWLAPGGRTPSPEDVLLLLQPWRSLELRRAPPADLELESCALLLRLVRGDGGVAFLRVPMALLREGDDLTLACRGNDVVWSRREVWRARVQAEPGATAQWPESGLRLAQSRVPYAFDELEQPSGLPGALARTLLAPLAWTLDVLAWTNPVLQAWFESMVDKPRPFEPTQSGR